MMWSAVAWELLKEMGWLGAGLGDLPDRERRRDQNLEGFVCRLDD